MIGLAGLIIRLNPEILARAVKERRVLVGGEIAPTKHPFLSHKEQIAQ